ncbi:MAG: complex I NDUFA9 subunit family protein [Parvibaculales bacterium]
MSKLGKQTQKVATVFGGSGFIGRHLVRALARDGWRVRVAVRRPNSALFLKTAGDPGQVTIVAANITKAEQVEKAVKGADAVINLVGILHESGKQKFDTVQAGGSAALAQAAAKAKATHFIQLSAIGADPESLSAYGRSKGAGEEAVLAAFKKAVILRPSLVIGPEDGFFNRFAQMATLLPALPLFGGGQVNYQPVYVGDVAAAIVAALAEKTAQGKIYELGGPTVYSFKTLMELMLQTTGQRRLLLPLPFLAAEVMSRFTQFLPNPPLTPDQVIMLRADNVVSEAAADKNLTLDGLNVVPTPIEGVIESYLARFRGGKN